MLFKFTSTDIENTSIIDCSTGAVIYEVTSSSPCSRSRSRSTTSLRSIASGGSSSKEKLYIPEQKVTSLLDSDGHSVAEIVWEERHASVIRIGDETLAGTGELFDASFVKVLPDETLIPTRMEYVWRTTPESLTLLDDDGMVIGKLHSNCISDDLIPAATERAGLDYLELEQRSPDELPELIVTYLLMLTLRERMYSITKYVYGQQNQHPKTRNPINRLRRRATRSFANLYQTFRRTVS